MKKLVSFLLIALMLFPITFALSACGTTSGITTNIIIPDISYIDESISKTLLVEKGLIPKVTYEYNDFVDEGLVIDTIPEIGSKVQDGDIVTIVVSKGKLFYELSNAVGYMNNVTGIDAFSWGDNGKERTKGFGTPFVLAGYLYIEMYLKCRSDSTIEFYGDWGTASINDTFNKTVPIDVLYTSKTVNNKGEKTDFRVKIPLSDLDVQKPTNMYIKFDFTVAGIRQTFQAGFDLSW